MCGHPTDCCCLSARRDLDFEQPYRALERVHPPNDQAAQAASSGRSKLEFVDDRLEVLQAHRTRFVVDVLDHVIAVWGEAWSRPSEQVHARLGYRFKGRVNTCRTAVERLGRVGSAGY